MIQLICNYMSEAKELLEEGNVKIDGFKYPSLARDSGFNSIELFYDRIREIKEICPIIYHGHLPNKTHISSHNFINDFDLESMKYVCKLTGTNGISFHLQGADKSDSRETVIENSIKNIEYLKTHFCDMEFISFENQMGDHNEHVLDPEVIAEIIRSAEVNFLYDVSHAYWCSKRRNEDFSEYVSKLPMERVYEVHINGWVEKDGDIQAHMMIQDELYDHLNEVIKNYPVKMVTLEYGRHNDRIGSGCPIVEIGKVNEHAKMEVAEQLKRLSELIDSAQRHAT